MTKNVHLIVMLNAKLQMQWEQFVPNNPTIFRGNVLEFDRFEAIISYQISTVAILHYGSPSHTVVEQQLLIPDFSQNLENLVYLENSWKMSAPGIEPGPTGWKSDDLTITPQQLHGK